MHYVYIVSLSFLTEAILSALIPPYTVNGSRYMIERYGEKQVKRNRFFLSLCAFILSIKLSVMLINYLGW